MCFKTPFPSKETVGGSLYCAKSTNPTFFLNDPDVFGDSAEESGVKVEGVGAEDRRIEDD